MKQYATIVKGKKELLVAFQEAYFFDGVTEIVLHRKNGETTEYKIYWPLRGCKKVFEQVIRNIKRTHSKCFK